MKIQTIEKLFSFTDFLEYSYLLAPLAYFIGKTKKSPVSKGMVFYGIIFFCLLHFYYSLVPKSLQREYQVAYTFLEYSFYAFFLWHYINNSKIRRIIITVSIGFFFFHIGQYLIYQKTQKLDSISIAVETLIIFVFIVLYLRQFFKENVTNNIYELASFWVVVGMMIYLGFGFFFNILVNYIPQEQYENYWHFTFIPEIIKNILFGMVVFGYPPASLENKKNTVRPDIPNLDLI